MANNQKYLSKRIIVHLKIKPASGDEFKWIIVGNL